MLKITAFNRKASLTDVADKANMSLFPEAPELRRRTATSPIDEPILSNVVKPFDGVLESAWFSDGKAAAHALGADKLEELVGLGDRRFYASRENQVVPRDPKWDSTQGVKFIAFVKRKGGMTVAEFQHYWAVIHGPIVIRTPLLRGYIQSHLTPENYADGTEPPFDGTAELWWDTVEDYRASWASPEMQIEQHQDAARFCGSGPWICITKEQDAVIAR